MALLLVVDDDADLRAALVRYLEAKGHSTLQAPDAGSALKAVENEPVELVLLDLSLPDAGGLEVLESLRRLEPDLPVLILTGNADIAVAVRAMRLGANDYLVKPFGNEDLALRVQRALREARLETEVARLREHLTRREREPVFRGSSPSMAAVYEALERVAPTELTVVLQGESGCGKEVLARLIHETSARREGPFVAVDSGALPEALVESELFGYERGAFTGAEKTKPGQFELASGGTLFLDEIANLGLEAQAKLLRVLQERRVRRLGGKKDVPVEVRILAATNRDLAAEVRAGRFREDLFHRLNQFMLRIPPVRERPEDLEPMARHFLREACRQLGKSGASFSGEALRVLASHGWPGNARELKNTVTRAALLCEQTIEPEHLGITASPPTPPAEHEAEAAGPGVAGTKVLDLKKAVREATMRAESALIREALARA
ncbi:MAG: sigma-54 dependent transcriptional regulator, partial [Elusimicrobiota bacterium]